MVAVTRPSLAVLNNRALLRTLDVIGSILFFLRHLDGLVADPARGNGHRFDQGSIFYPLIEEKCESSWRYIGI